MTWQRSLNAIKPSSHLVLPVNVAGLQWIKDNNLEYVDDVDCRYCEGVLIIEDGYPISTFTGSTSHKYSTVLQDQLLNGSTISYQPIVGVLETNWRTKESRQNILVVTPARWPAAIVHLSELQKITSTVLYLYNTRLHILMQEGVNVIGLNDGTF